MVEHLLWSVKVGKHTDPGFSYVLQHNINEYNQEHNIHIVKVWERNITGRGVTVAVIDDGK